MLTSSSTADASHIVEVKGLTDVEVGRLKRRLAFMINNKILSERVTYGSRVDWFNSLESLSDRTSTYGGL